MSTEHLGNTEAIEFSDFMKVDMRVGRVVNAELNPKARTPAYIMEVDFGDLGIKKTSAQVTANYGVGDLVGRLVVAVVNFPVKRIAGVKSEVLVLASVDPDVGTVLLGVERPVGLGTRIL